MVSNPNYSVSPNYLPGIFGILKQCVSKQLDEGLEWLQPLFLSTGECRNIEAKEFSNLDVLAISNYIWNRDFNFRLAKRAKSENPSITVIAGGPDPDYKNPEFFFKHKYIDAVVIQDAEIPFGKIIESIVDGNWLDVSIPGVFKRGGSIPEKSRLPSGTDFERSSWIESQDMYDKMIKTIRAKPSGWVILPFETDRGCPFQCTFCDWGSNTFSKMRQFPMARIEAEIEWIARNRIEMVLLTNSNFGMFERDVKIAELFACAKQKFGFPIEVSYSLPKTKLKFATEILKIFAKNRMVLYSCLPFQSTSEVVLNAVARKPLAPSEIDNYIQECREIKADIHVQLILGQPGDTYPSFLNSLSDLARKSLFDGVAIHPFLILPNAPANDPKYRAHWMMKGIYRQMDQFAEPRAEEESVFGEYCVETSSYTKTDYVDMWMLGCIYQAMMDVGILRYPVQFLNKTGQEFSKIFSDLHWHFFESPKFPTAHRLCREVKEHLHRFVTSDDVSVRREFHCPDLDARLEPHEHLAMSVIGELDSFLEEFKEFFLQMYSDAVSSDLIVDLIHFQKSSLTDPDTNPNEGHRFVTHHNWHDFFHSPNEASRPVERLSDPLVIHATHQESANFINNQFTFQNESGKYRMNRYYYECVSSNFVKPRVLMTQYSHGNQ